MMDALLAHENLVELARRIRGEHDVADAVARAAWTVIAEPGDAVAGTLIAELGAADALDFALGSRPGQTSPTGEATERGGHATRRAMSEGRARWRPRADPRAVRDALLGALDVNAMLLVPGDEFWPSSFHDLGANAPSALWVRGRAELLVAEPRYW